MLRHFSRIPEIGTVTLISMRFQEWREYRASISAGIDPVEAHATDVVDLLQSRGEPISLNNTLYYVLTSDTEISTTAELVYHSVLRPSECRMEVSKSHSRSKETRAQVSPM